MLRVLFCLLFPSFVFGQESKNVTLLDQWAADSLMTNSLEMRYNDCWGFVNKGQEYAVAGSTEGTHFFLIDEQNQFVPVAFVKGNFAHPSVIHRDFKTYRNYVYSVCDEGLSSLQIIDISDLPNSVTLAYEDSINFARVHNLFIDSTNALMYACIASASSEGTVLPPSSMRVYSLIDPVNPSLVYTGPDDIPEVHDAHVRNNIAYLNCGFEGLRVYDFTNPTSPIYLQNLSIYQEQGYSHQGWLSPDGTKYVFGDETNGKKLKFCEIENNLVSIESYFGTNYEENSVPHNIMLSNDFAYVAYYNEGLRIYDMRETPPQEIAHYDTHPQEEGVFTMRGAWGIYAELPSGRILVSDRKNGLFLFDFEKEIFEGDNGKEIILFSNPSEQGSPIRFRLKDSSVDQFEYRIVDMAGKTIDSASVVDRNYAELEVFLAVGIYTLEIRFEDYLGDSVEVQQKLMIF